jgi:hypothetical protein
LYEPNTVDPNQPLVCNGQQNVFCASQINSVAQNILNLYPAPNANNGKLYNNYLVNVGNSDDTVQWDQRLDWNISAKDQSYARYSYLHEIKTNGLPLGGHLTAAATADSTTPTLAMNFMGSETHIFTPSLTNEFRFGYNWGVFNFQQPNAYNPTLNDSLGLGPQPPGLKPGQYGLPSGYVNGTIQQWGSTRHQPRIAECLPDSRQRNEDLGEPLSEVWGILPGSPLLLHLCAFRSRAVSLGRPVHRIEWCSQYRQTGNAVADMLVDQENYAQISVSPNVNDAQWYDAGYVQDDWKLTRES